MRRPLRTTVFAVVLAGALRIPATAAPPQISPGGPEPRMFQEFTRLVQEYVKLRKALPRERITKRQDEIVDRRHTLAQAIHEARAGAKQGDIFTPDISEQFLKIIRSTLQGSA